MALSYIGSRLALVRSCNCSERFPPANIWHSPFTESRRSLWLEAERRITAVTRHENRLFVDTGLSCNFSGCPLVPANLCSRRSCIRCLSHKFISSPFCLPFLIQWTRLGWSPAVRSFASIFPIILSVFFIKPHCTLVVLYVSSSTWKTPVYHQRRNPRFPIQLRVSPSQKGEVR